MAGQSSIAPPTNNFANFKYEPLDVSTSKSSIRLATLLPGKRASTVRVKLTNNAFADRPNYEALSYTWGSPHDVRGIELNGLRVNVRENLWTAFVNLRDEEASRILWIDAICINQADIEERNHQVKLMAYIYTRAQMVLVWLGDNSLKDVRKAKISLHDDSEDFKEICNRPYWKRVWIVQEIGAATDLKVHWGQKSTSWEIFFQKVSELGNVESALRLNTLRNGRHGSTFSLSNLIEECKDSLCEEPRDKIYGFFGIAHDCQDNRLPLDYSKSLFEIYEDVIWFQIQSTEISAEVEKNTKPLGQERSKKIIHFSQLVQETLGGSARMKADFAKIYPGREVPFLPPSPGDSLTFSSLKILGLASNKILLIGPTYNDIIAIPNAMREWKMALTKGDFGLPILKLRKENEGFLRVLLNLDGADLAKARPIVPHYSWKFVLHNGVAIPQFLFSAETPPQSDVPQEPRLFLTSSGEFGLVPSTAREGDTLWRFWNSDVVAVVRDEGDRHRRIIGRAVIVDPWSNEDSKFYAADDVRLFDGRLGREMFMDIRTLLLMTE